MIQDTHLHLESCDHKQYIQCTLSLSGTNIKHSPILHHITTHLATLEWLFAHLQKASKRVGNNLHHVVIATVDNVPRSKGQWEVNDIRFIVLSQIIEEL